MTWDRSLVTRGSKLKYDSAHGVILRSTRNLNHRVSRVEYTPSVIEGRTTVRFFFTLLHGFAAASPFFFTTFYFAARFCLTIRQASFRVASRLRFIYKWRHVQVWLMCIVHVFLRDIDIED